MQERVFLYLLMLLTKSDIKIIQSLKTAHGRKKHGAFLVEGPKLVEELLKSQLEVKYLLATQEWSNQYGDYKEQLSILKSGELDKFSLFPKSNQVIAIVNHPGEKENSINTNNHILVLDTIQDPGNLGTIIRTADWFGIKQIICSKETADVFNPKVVQSSMGSVFRVDVQYTDLVKVLESHPNAPVYGTLLEGTDIRKIAFKNNGFIIIGNESKGISDPLKKLIEQAVFIPRSNDSQTESLNASVACGILLSHLPK